MNFVFCLHFNSLKSSLVSRLCDYVTCDFCMLLYADDNAMGHVMYVFALQRLVQGHGALKAGSIDVSTLDKDIATLLDQTVHVSQEIQPIELPDLAEPCWSFLCKEDPAYNLLKRMVQNFWNVIQSKRVKPGCLLLISTSIHGVPDTAYYLGTMLKRPLLQTLIEATVNDQEAEYRMLPSGMPHILTAHELFLTFLRSSDDMSQVQVKVEVWKCQCFLQDRCHLKANPSDCIVTFEVTTARPALKPAIHVPGILKKLRKRTKKRQPRRPRKVSAKAAAEAAAKAKAMAVAGHVFSCMSDSDIEGGWVKAHRVVNMIWLQMQKHEGQPQRMRVRRPFCQPLLPLQTKRSWPAPSRERWEKVIKCGKIYEQQQPRRQCRRSRTFRKHLAFQKLGWQAVVEPFAWHANKPFQNHPYALLGITAGSNHMGGCMPTVW